MPKSEKRARDRMLNVRVTEVEHHVLTLAAHEANTSVGAFVRDAALRRVAAHHRTKDQP